MSALEEAAGVAGVRLRRLDKKGEKAVLHSERQALEKQLQSEEEPAVELSLAIPLLVQRVRQLSVALQKFYLKLSRSGNVQGHEASWVRRSHLHDCRCRHVVLGTCVHAAAHCAHMQELDKSCLPPGAQLLCEHSWKSFGRSD